MVVFPVSPVVADTASIMEILTNFKKPMNNKCKYCIDLDELCWESPDEPFHGEEAICEECGAEYYKDYEREVLAVNDIALENHPELKKV